MKRQYFIAGTDTDVGKTRVAAGLLARARQRGWRTAAVKPVAAGCQEVAGEQRNDDALRLQSQCRPPLAYAQVNPVALAPAIAPHIAAEQAAITLNVKALAQPTRAVLALDTDFALVEGAGGWRVPLNRSETLADLAACLRLPVILVVGVRLGCINHALLTAEAISRDGLPLAGWVANIIDPETACLEENLTTLRQHLAAPCLGVVPHLASAEAQTVADFLNLDALK